MKILLCYHASDVPTQTLRRAVMTHYNSQAGGNDIGGPRGRTARMCIRSLSPSHPARAKVLSQSTEMLIREITQFRSPKFRGFFKASPDGVVRPTSPSSSIMSSTKRQCACCLMWTPSWYGHLASSRVPKPTTERHLAILVHRYDQGISFNSCVHPA